VIAARGRWNNSHRRLGRGRHIEAIFVNVAHDPTMVSRRKSPSMFPNWMVVADGSDLGHRSRASDR